MRIESGTELLHYRLVEKIGEGGMGIVWRAVDTTLGRDVAVKVLPDTLAADADRMARFEREAKLLASLNHPNIATVYGLHDAGGLTFLAMELVPGEDLAERIARDGALPVSETREIGVQIARALEAAHDAGVVHRDLKPANIQITPDGDVKVLDFGLAKALEQAPISRSGSVELPPTVTSAGTEAGVILGTAAYMSPEQAHGRSADQRADLWALGAVLYEMLTGARPFQGESVSDTLAAVLRAQPDLDRVPPDTSRSMRRLVRRCLVKDPRKRLHHAADARIELEAADRGEDDPAHDGAGADRPATRIGWIAGGALVVGLVIGALAVWVVTGRGDRPATTGAVSAGQTRFSIDFPDHEPLMILQYEAFDISRDGTRIVYVDEARGLMLRRLDSLEPEHIPGTELALGPFFSPDGEWVGFYDSLRLKLCKLRLDGGARIDLADVPYSPRGSTWNEDGTIVYSPSWYHSLWRVSDNGGDANPLTRIDPDAGIRTHRAPRSLPGNRGVLFTIGNSSIDTFDDASVAVYEFDTGEVKILLEGGSDARYLPDGRLVYAHDGRLLAVGFDLDSLTVTGEPEVVLTGVVTSPTMGLAQYAFADNGTLVYMPGMAGVNESRLVRVGHDGTIEPLQAEPRVYTWIRSTRTGNRLLVRTDGANGHLWAIDPERGTLTRLTSEWDNDLVGAAPDDRMVYIRVRGENIDLMDCAIDGPTDCTVLVTSDRATFGENSVSPDGSVLLYEHVEPDSSYDVMQIELDGDRRPRPWLATRHDERSAVFAPDDVHVAFVSGESGRLEVYLASYEAPEVKQVVSVRGGMNPAWAPDGRALYFKDGDAMMRVAVDLTAEPPRIGPPERLFDIDEARQSEGRTYDVLPDGSGFVTIVSNSKPVDRLNVVAGWIEPR